MEVPAGRTTRAEVLGLARVREGAKTGRRSKTTGRHEPPEKGVTPLRTPADESGSG